VFNAGQGAMSLIVLTPETSVATVIAATNGEPAAIVVLNAADQLLRQVHDRHTRRTALLCTLCDNPLWRNAPPHALGVMLPFGVDAPRDAVGLAFCASCVADRSDRDLALAVVTKLRSHMMPDLRVMSVMAQAGHA
jgi:hypothetical protein